MIKATLALRVDDQRRVCSVAVLHDKRVIAELPIEDVVAIVRQIERMEQHNERTEREDC
jgi:hypothetical protein